MCYTGFALSDLAVSSGLPFVSASLPGTDFSPSPYSVYPSVSHPETSRWTVKKTVRLRGFEYLASFIGLLEWTGQLDGLECNRGFQERVVRTAMRLLAY
jgi:hypothetical protein